MLSRRQGQLTPLTVAASQVMARCFLCRSSASHQWVLCNPGGHPENPGMACTLLSWPCLDALGDLGGPVSSQKLESVILMGPYQLWILHDSKLPSFRGQWWEQDAPHLSHGAAWHCSKKSSLCEASLLIFSTALKIQGYFKVKTSTIHLPGEGAIFS